MARVAHQHNALEVLAGNQVVGHHLLPAGFIGLGHGRVPVAGQVGQHSIGHALFTQGEKVNALGAARFARGKSKLFLLGQRVDAGGLAGVGAADEGDFRHGQRGQKMQLRGGGEEFGGVQPARGHNGGRRGGRDSLGRGGWALGGRGAG